MPMLNVRFCPQCGNETVHAANAKMQFIDAVTCHRCRRVWRFGVVFANQETIFGELLPTPNKPSTTKAHAQELTRAILAGEITSEEQAEEYGRKLRKEEKK